MKDRDVAVIGAGPVGLFAIFALGQVGLSSVTIDALHEAGGQCTALYPEKPIFDIPSRPRVTARDLVEDLLKQAEPYEPNYMLGLRAETLAMRGDRFALGLSDGSTLEAGAILVAAGAGAFGPNRPPLAGIETFEGSSVFYSVHVPERFRGQKIVIAGGGDSALDWAIILADIAASVTLVHRRAQFRAAPASLAALQELVSAGRIRLATPRALHALTGQHGQISSVAVRNDEGDIDQIEADALLCFYGLAKDLSALSTWDIAASHSGIPVDRNTMQTQRSGIFAIGDIAHYVGKLKLILTGFAEATAAAHCARAYLNPEQAFHFEYSTNRGRPGRDNRGGNS